MGNKIKVYVEGIGGEVYTKQDNTLKELAKEVYDKDYKKNI